MVMVACAALLMPGCGTPPAAADLIVGEWESVEPPGELRLEFARDGTATLTMLGQRLRGTYKLDGDVLEWRMGGDGTRGKVKVTASELELTSEAEGKTIRYRRI